MAASKQFFLYSCFNAPFQPCAVRGLFPFLMLRFFCTLTALTALFLLGLSLFGPDSVVWLLVAAAVGYVLLLIFGAVCAVREERQRKREQRQEKRHE